MADKKISELTTASEIKNGDNLELSQDTGSGLVSLKATILAIANKMLKGINFASDLQTTEKTVIGAINEVAQGGGGGSSTLGGLTDVDIDDTTLADGQALVYNGTEEKWVNGQGGGGTGGHTIIDENGNSMTARAGLQFVGGANVEDDGTNNRTIVDLASAGGIDGVFIDTENVIKSTTGFTNSMSYTATEDCVIAFYIVGKTNTDGLIKIDDKKVGGFYASSTVGFSCFYNLKDGQTITVTNAHASYSSDYTVYGIQTGTTHSKFQPVIYSTEEREIGVWTDGKPLYEKTITFSNVSKSGKAYFGIANSDTIFVNDGYITEVDTMLPYVHGTASGNNIGGFIRKEQNNSDSYWEFRGGNDAPSTLSGWMNVRYTKTTDVAGSGTWTPQGVPTHHYSTDEQVIGTWVDGSTLYEKTIEFGALPNNTTKTVAYNISNLNNIVDVKGIAYNQNGARPLPFVDDAYKTGDVLLDTIKNSGVVRIISHADLSSLTGYVTLQYTKTS